MGWPRVLRRTAIGMLVLGGAAQLVPYGWWHENPPVTETAVFPSARAEELARAACMDCHSNETRWPAYGYVAPMSWLLRRDVERGRAALNLSEWDREQDHDGDDAADEIDDGTMPPRQYLLAHPDARLSDADKQLLADAFERLDEPGRHP